MYRKRQRAKQTPCVYHDKPELDTIEKQRHFYELSGHNTNTFFSVYSAKVHELDAERNGSIRHEKR